VLAAVVSAFSLTICALPTVSAQNLFVTSDRTIAGGNPINGTFEQIQVGVNADLTPFPNISADFTGGTATFLNALNGSTVNISGGTVGRPPSGPFIIPLSVNIAGGSTVNLNGGNLISAVVVHGTGGDGGSNTFNMSGGTVNGFLQNDGGVVNISGGSFPVTAADFSGSVVNAGSGTINVTGGSIFRLTNVDFSFSPGTINFGGTATVNTLNASGGVTNISGGTISSGGVAVRETGVANFFGSGLSVNLISSGPVFDEDSFTNFVLSSYTVTGTLSNGAALNTTVTAGDFSNSGSLATFNAPALAPDLFVTTDQTVTGVYNNVNVGIDETLSTPSNPTATVAAGTDTISLTTYSQSITLMTGGLVRGGVLVTEQSRFDLSGGDVPGGIYTDPGSTVNISGGAVSFLSLGGTGTISGGAVDFVELSAGATLIVQGSGLTATADGPLGLLWDPNSQTNYLAAANIQVAGTLVDGTAFDQTVVSSGATGTTNQQTVGGALAAPDLSLTENTTTSTAYNRVTIGSNDDGTVNTSPTVNFAAGTNVGGVSVRNQSTLNIQGGVVNGTIFAGGDTVLNISGGTVSRLFQFPRGTGGITVSGGATTYIAPAGDILVTGGTLGTLDTFGGAQVRIEGGNVGRMLLFGGRPGNLTQVTIAVGTVGTIDFKDPGNVVSILGGSVAQVWGAGGSVYIYGGLFGPDALLNYRSSLTLFDIFGTDLLVSGAVEGTYTDNLGRVVTGVWWNVSGILESGTPLDTRYFERNGNLGGPVGLVFNVAIPEPGTSLLLAAAPMLGLMRRRRTHSLPAATVRLG